MGLAHSFRGLVSPLSAWQEAWQHAGRHGAGEGTESPVSPSICRQQEVKRHSGTDSNLKAQPQWHTSPNEVTPSPTRSHALILSNSAFSKYSNIWAHSHSDYHRVTEDDMGAHTHARVCALMNTYTKFFKMPHLSANLAHYRDVALFCQLDFRKPAHLVKPFNSK